MIPHKRLSWANIFEDYPNIYEFDKSEFLSLLEFQINLDVRYIAFFIMVGKKFL